MKYLYSIEKDEGENMKEKYVVKQLKEVEENIDKLVN